MQLILYKTNDANNVINKTLLAPKTLDINLRKHINISSPELILKFDDSILEYNYCKIVDLERFYFVDSIESVNKQLWKLSLSTDVLETFKADILASNARFKRGIRTGDYLNVALDANINQSVSLHYSNVSMSEGNTLILSTIGGV